MQYIPIQQLYGHIIDKRRGKEGGAGMREVGKKRGERKCKEATVKQGGFANGSHE